jgi:hypothetical protein
MQIDLCAFSYLVTSLKSKIEVRQLRAFLNEAAPPCLLPLKAFNILKELTPFPRRWKAQSFNGRHQTFVSVSVCTMPVQNRKLKVEFPKLG